MRNIFILFVAIMLVINFTACSSSSENTVHEKMLRNIEYTLEIGDAIQKTTSDAVIQIIQNSENNETIYILIEGEAVLLRVRETSSSL